MRREGSKHARNADNNIYSGTEFRREEGGEERGEEGLGKEGTPGVCGGARFERRGEPGISELRGAN